MIRKIEPVEHVQKRKEMYLEHEEIIPESIAAKVVSDALTLGVEEIWVRHYDTWWIIGSADDWLQYDSSFSIEEAFTKIIPLPDGPPEAFRREILLTAFADNVFIKKDQEIIKIKGSLPSDNNWLDNPPRGHRIIAFEFK